MMGVIQKLRINALKYFSFKNLLILSNMMSNLSGYFCIYINPTTFTRGKSYFAYFYYLLFFGFSVIADTYTAYVPIATITRSIILEFLYNFLNRCSVYFMCFFKVFNLFTHKRFFKVFQDLQWCNEKVIHNNNSFSKKK